MATAARDSGPDQGSCAEKGTIRAAPGHANSRKGCFRKAKASVTAMELCCRLRHGDTHEATMQRHDNLIGGEWRKGHAYTPNLNPSNIADTIGEYAQGDGN